MEGPGCVSEVAIPYGRLAREKCSANIVAVLNSKIFNSCQEEKRNKKNVDDDCRKFGFSEAESFHYE